MATGLGNLKMYQMAQELELEVHRFTEEFPVDERFRSIDQLKRSSSSVTNNIAEAYSKQSLRQQVHIYRDIVIGEAEETKSNLMMCCKKFSVNQERGSMLIRRYLELIKATNGYIRFLKETDKLKN